MSFGMRESRRNMNLTKLISKRISEVSATPPFIGLGKGKEFSMPRRAIEKGWGEPTVRKGTGEGTKD